MHKGEVVTPKCKRGEACKPWAETDYALLRPEVLFLCLAKGVGLISRLPSEGHNKFIKSSDDDRSRRKTVWIGAAAVTEGRTKKKNGGNFLTVGVWEKNTATEVK